MFPEGALLLPLSEKVLQVGATVHVLADHGDSVGVIHCLVKIVSEELEHIGVALNLVELNCFFL